MPPFLFALAAASSLAWLKAWQCLNKTPKVIRTHRRRPADAANEHSGDRVNIDAALVTRLIVEQFPHWADLPIRPVEPGGWDNRTFHLGENMTVRLPSAASYSRQVPCIIC